MSFTSTEITSCLPPSYDTVKNDQTMLGDYYLLYNHYAYGVVLPVNFPIAILKQFPNKSYKQQLKAAIVTLTATVNNLIADQQAYLNHYNTLYLNFAYDVPLPTDFPECIAQQFPNKSYKDQLKSAMVTLLGEINNEK